MGASYEFNWYLVIQNELDIYEVSNGMYRTTKREQRVYPISSEIPLIIKKTGCIGIVRILSFKVSANRTDVEFEFVKEMDIKDPIAKHYYDMYVYMKNK